MLKILYFSTVNWKWIKQRPHFISYYLSEQGHEVDYLSLNPFGKTFVRKLKLGRLNIIDLNVLPYSLKFKWIERINIAYIQSRIFRKYYDIIILTGPLQHQYIPDSIRSHSTLVYECMDNMPYFYDGALRERMYSEEEITLNITDGVITSSDQLKTLLKRRAPNSKVPIQTIHNALDQDTFKQVPKKISLREPNLLYIGTIGPWLDWDILNHFAARHPRFTIYLIGPHEMKEKLHPNIVCLGIVPHHEVIDYIYSGNIMLLPFKVNELTEAVDPVKLYEYLSLDKPVLSSYWPELDKFACDNLKFYHNYHEFEAYALEFLNKGYENTLNQHFIGNHSWINRVRDYTEFINIVHNEKHIKSLVEKGLQ